MADVITRFKLETTAFDSKLRDSAKSLQSYGKQAELAGKDFTNFSQKAIEAARSLGTIASGANNTKDKLKDLVGAYNDVAKTYNKLTDQQRQTDFGKAMSQSLEQLQVRIKETKDELYSLTEAVSGKGGGLFGEGGLTGMLQVAGGNLLSGGISMLAGKLKDAWSQSIELAKAGEGVRLAFDRLNQPNLLDKLKEATHGTVSEVELMKQAIQFDNFKLPLEDLATYLSFAQQKAKDTGQSIDYLVNSIVTGLGRQSKQILDNLGISAAELTKRMNEGADMTKAVADIIREEMEKAGDYVETAADRAAQAAATAADEMERFGRQAAPIAEEWEKTWNSISIGAMELANTILGPLADSVRTLQNIWNNGWEDNITNSKYNIENGNYNPQRTGYQGMGNLQKVTAPGGYVEVTDSNTGAVIGGQHFDNLKDKNSIKDWQKSLFKTVKKGGKTDAEKMAEFREKVGYGWDKASVKMQDFMPELPKSVEAPKGLAQIADMAEDALSPLQEMNMQLKGMIDMLDTAPDETAYQNMLQNIEDKQKEIAKFKGENVGADKMAKSWKTAQQAIAGVGSALSALNNPAIDIMTVIGQSIATIALAYSETLAKDSSSKSSIWGFIAAAAAATVSMATTIASIHSSTGYAEGGIVKGNSYSGDNMMFGGDGLYGLNAGEVVLTRAMQGNLASQLQSTGMAGMQMTARVRGTDLLLSIDRAIAVSGRGQLLTFK